MHYPGGKGQVFKKIINLIPPHEVYIETHLGGGSVILNKRSANRNIGIEIDTNVVNKWRNEYPLKTNIELINDDAVSYIKKFNFTGNEFIYCDPPYLRETRRSNRRIYKYEYSIEQHIELLKIIQTLPCKVMISGYESNLYKNLLKDWHSYHFLAGCNQGIGTEWLWMNYSSPEELHDYRFLGDNFRQREKIKNKTKRWTAKLQSMPVLERQALLHAIDTLKGKYEQDT